MSEFFYRAAGTIVAPFRYAEREAKAMKEHVKEDIQAYVAIALKLAVAGVAAILFLLFISIAVANWINTSMNSEVAGFAIVAAFYLLIAGTMYALKLADDRKKKEVDNNRKAMQGKPVHA
ncbi:MAG: phage holin family protein [Bacteroidota bacterium]|nr:phage holin family protein [Bacteroidota bacterium]